MSFWKTPSFKALQQAWYQRLAAEGFQDAEEMVADEPMLKQTAEHVYRNEPDLSCIRIKEEYFQSLAHKVNEFEFDSDVHRTILAMFAEGARIKKICEELERQGKSRSRGGIRFIIRKYEMTWGLKKYTAKQLNKRSAS